MPATRVNFSFLLPFMPHCVLSCGYTKPTYCALFREEPVGT